MIKRELERLIFEHHDDIRIVATNPGSCQGQVFDMMGCDLMYLVAETGELYLKAENAKEAGKETELALVLWIWGVQSD